MGYLVDTLWFDLFVGGTAFFPSMIVAFSIVFGVAICLAVSTELYVGRQLITFEGMALGFVPSNAVREDNDAVDDYRLLTHWWSRLFAAFVITVQVFTKVWVFNVAIKTKSYVQVALIATWVAGVYFYAGWAWIFVSCPPWHQFCD